MPERRTVLQQTAKILECKGATLNSSKPVLTSAKQSAQGDINTDAQANIVTKAGYAVIGDLHVIVPAISAEIRRRKNL